MNRHQIFASLVFAVLLSLGAGFGYGLPSAQPPTVSAQTTYATLSPAPVDSWEDFQTSDYLYWLGATYNCPPLQGRTTTSFVDATAAYQTFVVPSGCDNGVRTTYYVDLCATPQEGTIVRSTVTFADSSVQNINLQPTYPGSSSYELELTTPIASAPVSFNTITNPAQHIIGVDLEYDCGGCVSGELYDVGWYDSECDEYNPLVFFGTSVPRADCDEGPWVIDVRVIQECPQQVTYEGAPVYAIQAQNQMQVIGYLDANGVFISDCNITELPQAIGIAGVMAAEVFAAIRCCDC